MNRPAYALLSLLLVAVPLAVDTGDGVRVVAALAAVALVAGYAVTPVRTLGAGLALAAVGVAAGASFSAGSLVAGGAAGVLALLLLTLPPAREVDGWVLCALALELPVAVGAAALAALPLPRLPLLVGLAAAAVLVGLAIPADRAIRRRP